ncbi:hypothetical protein CPB85DRAFT_1568268 [Mucidula mucida]|nr:hypothetical protein CPB85DRAFT_1568268 [Mucidula mucida]
MSESALSLETKCNEPACTADVDIVLKSIDGVLFGAHLQLLSLLTEAFTMPDNVLTLERTEVVDLPEDAATLEVILKFVHPQRPPATDTISDDLLVRIAEAVEKYGVYPGMEACRLRMKQMTSTHPLQVLVYAVRHGHNDIIDDAASYSVYKHIEEAWKILRSNHIAYIAWTIYREERKMLAREVFDYSRMVDTVHHRSNSGKTVTMCETWTEYLQKVTAAVGSEPSVNLKQFRAVCSMQPGQYEESFLNLRKVGGSDREEQMHSAFVSKSDIAEPSEFTLTEEGKVMQDRYWGELIEVLAKTDPKISGIVKQILS